MSYPQPAIGPFPYRLAASTLKGMPLPLNEAPPPLAETLAIQENVAARAQLLAAGMDDMAIYRHLRRGDWQRLLPGVYLLAVAPIATEQRRIAASLYSGDNAQLTGLSGLHWYGFRHAPGTDKVHMLVRHETRRRSTGFVLVQRTHALDRATRDLGLYRVVSPARAVVDACRAAGDLRTVRAIITEAVQRNFAPLNVIADEVARANRSRTAIARQVISEVSDGVRSSPEAELREALLESRVIPLILWNPMLLAPDGSLLPRPDGYIPDAAVALEVDSREHHSDNDDWARTLHRHNLFSQFGVLVLHFLPTEIRAEPTRVRRIVERAYLSRIENPTAPLIRAPSSTETVKGVPLLTREP